MVISKKICFTKSWVLDAVPNLQIIREPFSKDGYKFVAVQFVPCDIIVGTRDVFGGLLRLGHGSGLSEQEQTLKLT